MLNADQILSALKDVTWPLQLQVVAETGSTNQDLARLAQAGAPTGLLLVADAQTAGRGRMARIWHSPAGVNLYVSLLLRPQVSLERAPTLTLLLGLALTHTLHTCFPALPIGIKWPNDILSDGKKMCGVLCEMHLVGAQLQHIIAGFGLNVNLTHAMVPPEVAARCTSLKILTQNTVAREELLVAILRTFYTFYAQWCGAGLTPFIELLARYDLLQDQAIRLEEGGRELRGIARGIAPDGTLILETATDRVPVYSGEAHTIRGQVY